MSRHVNMRCDLNISSPIYPPSVMHVSLQVDVTWRSHQILTWTDSLIHGSAYNVDIILVFGDNNYQFFLVFTSFVEVCD